MRYSPDKALQPDNVQYTYQPYLSACVMSHKAMRLIFIILLLFNTSACNRHSNEISKEIARQFEESGQKSIILSKAVPGKWDKVCILGPYSNNKTAKDVLGFEWHVEQRTSISSDDGISLLLFVKGKEVLDYVEHARNEGDFSNLSGQCFHREKAIFVHKPAPKKGWPGLFNKQLADESFIGTFSTVTESECNRIITLSSDRKGELFETCRLEDGSSIDEKETIDIRWVANGNKIIVSVKDQKEVLTYHEQLSCMDFGKEGSSDGLTGMDKKFWRTPITCQ